MSRSDSRLVYCKCTTCVQHFGPDGHLQTNHTARRHREADDRSAQSTLRSLASSLPSVSISAILPPSPAVSGPADPPIPPPPPSHLDPDDSDGDLFDFFDPGYAASDIHHVPADPTWSSNSDSDSDIDMDWTFCQRRILPKFKEDSSEESSVHSDSDDDIIENISVDPSFATCASLFNSNEPDNPEDPHDKDLPPAFYDHPAVRNAYIRVFVGCAFENMTHKAARLMLNGFVVSLGSLNRTTGEEIPGLDNFALTLVTVERRLGVSTQGFITYLFVCPLCWKVHHPEDLPSLPESGKCMETDCEGTLFTSKRMADGKLKRTPTKIMPFVDPEHVITHMLMRPGKYEQIQLWRGPEDKPGRFPPVKVEGYDAFPDPDKPMKNITDGWAWRAIQAGLTRRRTGKWKVEDIDVREINQFQAVKGGMHSTGAIYMTLCNNPREIQFLREETAFVLAIPGPHEPSLEQMNQVLVSFTNSMKRLYNGLPFRVYHNPEPILAHSQILSNVSDLPASRKTAVFVPRDDSRHLKYAFRARDASPEVAEDIFRKRGVHWSSMNELVNWFPAKSSSVDPMHAFMLTLIKHLNRTILYNNGLLNSTSEISCIDKMEAFFGGIIWPVSIGRLPPSLSHGSGSVKADQWHSQISVLFLALFAGWQVDGEIPDIDAPPSAPKSKLLQTQRKSENLVRQRLLAALMADNPNPYEADIEAIQRNPNEVRRGFSALSNAVQSWARMHCHLTPYFHLAFHTEPQFYAMGPMYNWWTFGYERNNGFLGRFNHNGHSGGELEGTMMRHWWKTTFIHDLITNLENLENPAPEDVDSVKLLKSYLQGGTKERRGTLQNSLPKRGYYRLIFDYLSSLWASVVRIYSDVSNNVPPGGAIFKGHLFSFSHIFSEGYRYGAASTTRGQSAQYAYIDAWMPVQIQHIFRAIQPFSRGGDKIAEFAVVRRFCTNEFMFEFPWDLWATDLGVRAWYAEKLGPAEIVRLSQFTGHFILAPWTVRKKDLWFTVAHDHVESFYLNIPAHILIMFTKGEERAGRRRTR
ncbi:hypothetical protein C8J57DRAFT_1231919 [Mycena rebaudengoi]|nr:hypothetical protein C8J57DRAFT_1231919 [Mycena rebaudengoi]